MISPARTTRRSTSVATALGACAVLLLAGCGSGGGATTDAAGVPATTSTATTASTTTASSGGGGEAGTAVLTIEVRAKAGAAPRSHDVECPTHVGAVDTDACAALEADPGLLAEPPADTACSQVYGGPQVAHVTGTLDGDPVDVTITRTNGCGISRWTAAQALLGDPDAA